METKKMMETAKVIDVLLKVVQVIDVVGGIGCLISLVLVPIFRKAMLTAKLDGGIDLGDISLVLMDSSMKDSIIDWNTLTFSMMTALISTLVICVIVWYGITLLLRVIAPMKEGRPFDTGVSSQIRKLAWVVLVGGAVSEAASYVARYVEIRAFDVTAMFNYSVVTGYTYNGVFDTSFVASAVVLFLLSYIFRYGEGLQRESDETL
jgi:hypothetical protein